MTVEIAQQASLETVLTILKIVLGLGFLAGALYPFYVAFLSPKAQRSDIPANAKAPAVLTVAAIVNGFRFTLYTLLSLTILIFVGGILYSLYAIIRDLL